jgi:hypothetical protein
LIDELLAGARRPEEITGPDGLLQRLTKRLRQSLGVPDECGDVDVGGRAAAAARAQRARDNGWPVSFPTAAHVSAHGFG